MIGDGKECHESNACETADCHANAECVPKTATTFECKCKEGYVDSKMSKMSVKFGIVFVEKFFLNRFQNISIF